ncbi:hypothetical protein I7I53_00043 [Histoplasma capsulatum var. duboisii H88]|uniref:Uncharacterized protein n=1 Tax=Ajellomyces capsulatus (strain H88) TaxID=544711 RepID=A0A8A1LKH3_AJEC8|nr:hypothetical protein I7I53_00043 [Histoplasma capsulatum var. duboisii H88]
MKKPNKKTHKQYEETIPQPSAHPHRSSSPCPAQADPMLVRYVTLDKGHWQMQQHKSYVL